MEKPQLVLGAPVLVEQVAVQRHSRHTCVGGTATAARQAREKAVGCTRCPRGAAGATCMPSHDDTWISEEGAIYLRLGYDRARSVHPGRDQIEFVDGPILLRLVFQGTA